MKIVAFLLCLSVGYSFRIPYQEVEAITNYNLSFFNASIDHYAPNSPTFQLKYYIRTDYYEQTRSGPIFFYCGHQAPIEFLLTSYQYLDTLAASMDAVVVYAEHRYFGTSLPFGNLSFSNPDYVKYLSPHQALADYAELISHLKRMYFNSPVIAWGGDYGGILAAWFRMKFPHLVDGTISSSAPLLLFNGTTDPYATAKLITQHFSIAGGPECPAVIRTAFEMLVSMIDQPQYYFELQSLFNTCEDIITGNDVKAIMGYLYQAFGDMSLVDFPYPNNIGPILPANPVSAACSLITNIGNISDYREVFPAVLAGANLIYNASNPDYTCNELNLNKVYGRSELSAFEYLLCTTLNWPIATNGASDMFWNNPWDQNQFDSQCLQTWGEATQPNYASLWYGTSNNITHLLRHASNILFSSGSTDPMIAGSITTNVNTNVVVYFMQGANHVHDLRAPNQNDPPEVNSGRGIIRQTIQYWVNGTIS